MNVDTIEASVSVQQNITAASVEAGMNVPVSMDIEANDASQQVDAISVDDAENNPPKKSKK